MPYLIEAASADASSSAIVATGPIVVSVTGTMTRGLVKITADIGGGEAVAYLHVSGEPTSLARLELPAGASFKAYLVGPGAGDSVNVNYLYV